MWGEVRCGDYSRKKDWTSLHINISTNMKYPFHAYTLTEKECRSIMYPSIKVALPKCAITASMKSWHRWS